MIVTICLRFVTNSYNLVAIFTSPNDFKGKGIYIYMYSANLDVSLFDNQRPYWQHGMRKKQVGVMPTVPHSDK